MAPWRRPSVPRQPAGGDSGGQPVKHGKASILKPAQERYLERTLPPRDELLREMEELARGETIPITDPEVGQLLAVLARATGARSILEIGTAIGYGTLWLARGAPEARIATIDISAEQLARARGFLTRGGVVERVELIAGAALDVLPRLAGPFDLVFIDAVKQEYRRYLDLTLPRLRVGGLVVVDNLLWAGQVADPEAEGEDEGTPDALRAFNGYLLMHPQLQSVLLPLGDGVGLATKTKPLLSELGGPF